MKFTMVRVRYHGKVQVKEILINRHMRVNKLMELDKSVPEQERIFPINQIIKMQREFKNK